jgi:adenylate cyclase class 2
VLTGKGPPIVGPHKSRPETEVGVADFERCDHLLRDLGYVLVFRYEKYRTELQNEAKLGTVTLDETPIGDFLELEGPSDWIDRTARDLGFSTSDYITSSYITLYMEFCKNRQVQPSFMTFQNGE